MELVLEIGNDVNMCNDDDIMMFVKSDQQNKSVQWTVWESHANQHMEMEQALVF
jgi:hypothetical protein